MRAAGHTGWLLAAVLLLGAADLAVHATGDRADAPALPALPGFDAALADRIHVGRADAPVVLEREGDRWELIAPVSAPADPELVSQLLDGLAGGVRLEARVDDGDLDRYGLDGGQERRVDVQQGERSLISLYVGSDAGGGATHVRLPGAEAVYRARIGGRARYDRSPGGWRDRQVTDLDPSAVRRIVVGDLVLERQGDGWHSADLAIDGPTVSRLAAALAKLRALEVAAPERQADADPVAVRLELADGEVVALDFGRSGELWHVRRAEERFRIAPELPELLAAAPASLADRALWHLPVADVERLEVVAPGREGLLERAGEGWRVVRPANVDVDERRADAAAAWLAEPRVDAWSEAPLAAHGFSSEHRWRVTVGAAVRTIELGAPSPDGKRVPVRDLAAPGRVGWIDARIVQGIEAIFGG